jgi:hypothetical protein
LATFFIGIQRSLRKVHSTFRVSVVESLIFSIHLIFFIH